MTDRLSREDYEKVEKTIIKKLYSVKAWGKGHLLVDRFKSGLPSHLRGDVDSVIRDLLKKQIVLLYGKTKYGYAIYLNPKKIKEIEETIKRCY